MSVCAGITRGLGFTLFYVALVRHDESLGITRSPLCRRFSEPSQELVNTLQKFRSADGDLKRPAPHCELSAHYSLCLQRSVQQVEH